MVKVSIVSPIRNEESVVEELVRRVTNVMSNQKYDWEFILVNDESTDNTSAILKELASKNKHLIIFNHERRKGQTGCFKTGFDNAKGEIVVTMDGDLQVMPEDIPKFIEKMDKGYDLVNAIRENRDDLFWIKFASRLYNALMLLFFNSPVMDNASNFTAIRTKFVKNLPLRGNDHRYLAPITVRRGVIKVGEVLVEHKKRSSGKSKYKALPKYIKGFPELFITFLRIKFGVYD